MGIDISVLCVLCVLCGGAMEIPRLGAPAHPDLLRVFAVNVLDTAGAKPGPFRTPRDPLWTRFFITFLPRPRHNPSPLNPFRKTSSRVLFFFRAPIRSHPPLPLHQMHQPATLSKLVSAPNPRSS